MSTSDRDWRFAARNVREFLVRNRFLIWDVSVLFGAAALLLVLAGEYELLRVVGVRQTRAEAIELGEVMLVLVLVGAMLVVSIRRQRAQAREVRRRIAAERRAHQLAFHDALTGLPNRRKFEELAAAAVASPPASDYAHAILMADLNGFKTVNDVYGHPTGDAVLKEVAIRLETVVRQSGDQVARLGGDEFAIVATNLRGPEDAAQIAERVIETLTRPIALDTAEHSVGTGIGIALFPADAGSSEELIRRADVALYKAKSLPASGYMFFQEEMDSQLHERAEIEHELRAAIVAEEIGLLYQPTFDLRTNTVMGFEALARWNHPKLGNVPPNRFIPIAEGCGIIRSLSDMLLRKACSNAARWPGSTSLAFNVSAVQLRDPAFATSVRAILGETGLTPSRLELEITESVLVKDMKTVESAVFDLRKAGVRVVLDDFGTGYSTLYHLRNFKVDRIKIDRSFIAAMGETESAGIVRALLGLGQGLGAQVTAEGVESPEQRDALIAAGCDHGQGFLFSRPITPDEADLLILGKLTGAPAEASAGRKARSL